MAELAKKLADITPSCVRKTFFGNSGAEAVECSVKLARKFTKKYELIALMCSFHGWTLGTLSVTGQAGRRKYDMVHTYQEFPFHIHPTVIDAHSAKHIQAAVCFMRCPSAMS